MAAGSWCRAANCSAAPARLTAWCLCAARPRTSTPAQMGNRGWSYADVLPFFKRMESYAGEGDDAFRGREGPLRVTNPKPRDPLFATIIKAAAEVGIR